MIVNFVKGILIGIANIIPGVSGGTFALILGIYSRLITALGEIDGKFFTGVFSATRIREQFKRIDAVFLAQIAAGAVIALTSLSWLIDYLLKYYPGQTLSFFMGLIIPSITVPYKMIEDKSLRNMFFVIPGVILVLCIYVCRIGTPSSDTGVPLMFLFFSGIIAVSAMILPGISGSFILLVMGVYQSVISHIKSFTASFSSDSLVYLCVFGTGCLVGLAAFVRLMKFLLNKFRDKTLYFLIGLVLGSLAVLWPFKEYPSPGGSRKTEIAVTTAQNTLPADTAETVVYLAIFGLGFACSFLMERIAKVQDNM